jgi:hypothetical protein
MAFSIAGNEAQFLYAMDNWQTIAIYPQNRSWTCHRPSLKQQLSSSNSYYENLAKQLSGLLDHIERKPLVFHCKSAENSQKMLFNTCKTIANYVIAKHKKISSSSLSIVCLKQRILALYYRSHALFSDSSIDSTEHSQPQSLDSLKALFDAAAQWKTIQPYFRGKPQITADEEQQIKTLCSYPRMAKLVSNNACVQGIFFKWTLLHKNPVKVFVQYPATTELLMHSFLSNVINRFETDDLQIRTRPRKEKSGVKQMVTLPFENIFTLKPGKERREISVLKGGSNTFKLGAWKVTIEEIFKDFQEQNARTPRIVYAPITGFQNFNRQAYTYYDAGLGNHIPIDFNQKRWWEQIPPIRVPKEKVAKIFDIEKTELEQGDGTIVVGATREFPDRSFGNAHGYQVVVFNDQLDDNLCTLYAWGKYIDPDAWPTTWFGKLKVLGATRKAIFCVHDFNLFYMQREHCYLPFAVSKIDLKKYVNSFKEDIINSLNGDLVFQLSGENCAEDTGTRINSNFFENQSLNLFKVPLLDLDNPVPLNILFKAIKTLIPTSLQNTVTRLILHICFPGRCLWIKEKTICKSLKGSTFWKDLNPSLPSMLFERVRNGDLQRSYRLSKEISLDINPNVSTTDRLDSDDSNSFMVMNI